jgi:hypothetical protein
MRANKKLALFKRKAAFNWIRGRESNTKLALFKRKAAFHWREGRGYFYESQYKAGSLQKERSIR